MVEPTGPAALWSDEDLEGSVPDRFEKQVDSDPCRLAIRVPGQDLTYGALDRWANRTAQALLESSGERAETSAILLGDRTATIAGILGATKATKIVLTLDTSQPQERLQFLVEDSEARSIVSGGPWLPLARSLAARTGAAVIDAGSQQGSDQRPGLRIPPGSPASLVYTSGSSGRPKGVVQSHLHVLWGCLVDTRRDRLTTDDRRLLVASPGAGAAISMYYALLNGAALFPFDVEASGLAALRDWIVSQEITIYQSVPAIFRSLARTFRKGESLPAVRLVRMGGDTVRREDVALFQRLFDDPCLMRVGYGSTEAGSIASRFIGARERLDDGPVAVGRPTEGIQIRLVDTDGRDADPGETGEIVVKGKYLADGYWRQPELTRMRFAEDPAGGPARTFRTGDIGRFGPDGLLFHQGRKDLQVKIRGNRVEVEEVEIALRALPDVEDAAVCMHPGPVGEDVLVGYVVGRGGPVEPGILRTGLLRALPDHSVPSVFVPLAALPLTPGKKVDRAGLPAPTVAPEPPDGFAGPGDDLERWLAALWERFLRIGTIDVRADFFEMGGNSLLAAELFSEIERRIGRYLPLSLLLEAPSVGKLAAVIREEVAAPWPVLVPIQPRGRRLPFFCVSWGEGEVLSYARLAARLGPDRPVYGLRRDRFADGRPRFTRVEEMAAQYVEEIRRVEPRGPYLIGGLSLGASIAFEMAKQLVSADQEVGAVLLMDPSTRGSASMASVHTRLPGGRPHGLGQGLIWYWTKWQLLDRSERAATVKQQLRRILRPERKAVPPLERLHPVGAGEIEKARDRRDFFASYSPGTYAGRVTLILARHQGGTENRLGFWRAAAKDLDVRVVPGLHEFILKEPFVRALAREVERSFPDGLGAG